MDNETLKEELVVCPSCGGDGWIVGTEAACCGGSQWECGASGCTGPVPMPTQEECGDCGGFGQIAALRARGDQT